MNRTTPENPLDQHRSRPRNRAVAIGLTAGLLGGTAAGMVFGVPGLTSADSATPSVVAQVDDDTDVLGDAPDARPEPGVRLREAIQPLVDDGTITADQADAVVATLLDAAPDREERRDQRGDRRDRREERRDRRDAPEAVQELLGLSPEELREQLRDGATLGEIAEEQGVEPQAVVDAIVAELTERVDAAVAAGKLDAERAAEKLAEAEERISERVTNGRPDRD